MSASPTQAPAVIPHVLPAMAEAAEPAKASSPARLPKQAKDTMAPAAAHKAEQSVVAVIPDAKVPHFDIDQIMAAKENRAELVKAYGDALKDVGFIAIKATRLNELVATAMKQIEKYSDQPLDVKKKDDHKNGGQTGFSQRGSETAAGSSEPDNKEFLHISPNLDKWPSFEGDVKAADEFRESMQACHKEFSIEAAKLMTLFEEYVGEKTEDAVTSISDVPNLLRAIHYPATKSNAPRAAAHCDLNAFTLLPPATEPGLQLLDKQGRWKAVTVEPGYLIVNTGEQLEMKTAGKIKATRHQVMKLDEDAPKRLAIVFFASWSLQFLLGPLKKCIEEMTAGMSEAEKTEYLKKYPNVTVLQNLRARLIEMRTIKNPEEKEVRELYAAGLLRAAPPELKALYPDLFGVKEAPQREESKEEPKSEKELVVLKV